MMMVNDVDDDAPDLLHGSRYQDVTGLEHEVLSGVGLRCGCGEEL